MGFEPTVGVNPRRFSRPVHSTTLPLLRFIFPKASRLILKAPLRTELVGNSADADAQTFLDLPLQLHCGQRAAQAGRAIQRPRSVPGKRGGARHAPKTRQDRTRDEAKGIA